MKRARNPFITRWGRRYAPIAVCKMIFDAACFPNKNVAVVFDLDKIAEAYRAAVAVLEEMEYKP